MDLSTFIEHIIAVAVKIHDTNENINGVSLWDGPRDNTDTHTHKRLKVQAHNMLLLTVATRAAQCIVSALQDL